MYRAIQRARASPKPQIRWTRKASAIDTAVGALLAISFSVAMTVFSRSSYGKEMGKKRKWGVGSVF